MTEEEAPGYFDVIKQPMDLSTIKERLNSGVRICPLSVVPSSYRVRMHLWTTTRCSRSCLRRPLSQVISSPTEFYRDLMLMFQNALTYNPKVRGQPSLLALAHVPPA